MLSGITIGQFFPGDSLLHRMDPRMKLVLTFGYIVAVFVPQNWVGLGIAIAFLFVSVALSRLPVKLIWKSVKPILPLIIFTSFINIFYVKGEVVLVDWWIIHITLQGVINSVFIAIRILCLIAGSSLLTYTTSPTSLTDALERLMKPLKALHVNVHELAMMMTIALRFIPTLIEETDKIMSAQKARGADMESRKEEAEKIKIEIDSLSSNEEFARVVIAVFMSRMNPTLEEIDDVKTAVSEAVTNAVIHGYQGEKGRIYIEAEKES